MKNPVMAALALIAFAAALAAIIGSRLSEQAVTLLMGAACGAGLTAPLAIVIGATIGAQRTARDRQPAQPPAPIVVMTPPQLAAQPAPMQTWANVNPYTPGLIAPAPRQYTILGEETVIDGTDSVWSQSS